MSRDAAPGFVRRESRLFDALRERLGGGADDSPEDYDPAHVARVLRTARRLYGPGRYFDLRVEGFDAVPPPPVMLVSNHSGGTLIPDVWGFGVAWYNHFGSERPLHILAHELLFAVPSAAHFFARAGVLRASRATAQRVLAEGRDLLAMPGGSLDVWRPWTERYKVHFGGRMGYARTALEAQVPIVPVAHAGAHDTLRVLSSGKGLARLLGLRRLARAEVWPIHLSLPWGLAVGPLPHLPLPARFRYRLGAPIEAPRGPITSDVVEAHDAQVRVAVQVLLEQLELEERAERRARAH